jgi:glycine C-acetyltransferase
MKRALIKLLAREMTKLRQAGLCRGEGAAPADTTVLADFRGYDYLDLAQDSRVRDAVIAAVREQGHGLSDSRPFSGTREAHKRLEGAMARLLGQSDAMVLGSGYLANIGLYGALFDHRDTLFCDAWIHPSSAEGVRLSGAKAVPYENDNLQDLADKLKRSRDARFRAIVTDGVFAFSGALAQLGELCDLAERYEALLFVDDTLGVGLLGDNGGGTCEARGMLQRVNVITGGFSKVLGGAAGGYVAGDQEVIDWLRQKATPYLFSGALPPASLAAAQCAVGLLSEGLPSRSALFQRVTKMSQGLRHLGFQVYGGEHPNLLAQVGTVVTLQKLINRLNEAHILVQGLCYPVVPEREARIRLQLSTRHREEQLDQTLAVLQAAGRDLGIV